MSTSTQAEAKRVTVDCPACRKTNPDADVNSRCSGCGEPLGPAVFQHSLDEIKRLTERMKEATAPSFNTYNGFGTTLLDYRELADGTWEATRWVVAAMLPLAPLGAYRINPGRQQNSYGREESYFEVLGRVPVSPARVLRVYGLMMLGLAPAVLGFMNSSWIDSSIKRALGAKNGGIVAALAMVGCVVWAAYILFYRIKNDSKAYRKQSA